MSRATPVALLAVFLVGVAAILVHASSDERPNQQVLGVLVRGNVATVRAGHTGCQGPIGLANPTPSVEFNPGTLRGEPGPAVDAQVRAAGTSRVLAHGLLRAGFDPAMPQVVAVTPTVPADAIVDVCFRNLGPRPVLLFGDIAYGTNKTGFQGVHPTIVTSSASLDGKDLPGRDIAVVFPRPKPKSVLALVPEMFRRASLFRPGWVGTWTLWVLAGLVLLAAPLLLARAAARAADGEED